MYKKIILSTLGGAIVLFLLGGLTFEVLLKDFSAEMMNSIGSAANTDPSFVSIALSQVAMALLMAIIFFKLNLVQFSSGLLNGAWIMFLIILWFDLWIIFSFNFMTPSMMTVDIVSNTVFGAIAGGVIALIQGKIS